MHRMCHIDSIFGLYAEYRYRNNVKMVRTSRYGGSERWQGTVIIENGDQYGKCRLPVIFSMHRTGAPLPTAGSGVPGVRLATHESGPPKLWVASRRSWVASPPVMPLDSSLKSHESSTNLECETRESCPPCCNSRVTTDCSLWSS